MANSTHGGHGGKNNFDMGAGGGGRWERTEVVKINNYFRQTNPNWPDVGDTVATNVNQNLINIVANTNKVSKSHEITLSHHLNAFNGKATGCEVWYYAGDAAMKAKATKISALISKALGIVDRGPKATTSLYVVSYTNAHCLLIEWYFVDNPNDRAAWDRNGVKAMQAVMKELGMKVPGATTTPKPNTPKPAVKRSRHSVMMGSLVKGSGSHKDIVAWLKKQGWLYTEFYRKDLVWIRCIFDQNSEGSLSLQKEYKRRSWNHTVVFEGQENLIIDNWAKRI